jgi:hypothetical protein
VYLTLSSQLVSMPGLYTSTSMNLSQATTNTHHLQAHDNIVGFESAVKDELDDGDIFQESDSDDVDAYKPRPQLPQPNVNMRSLGSLISK